MNCAFCNEFTRPGEGDRIIARSGDWRLLPTLGCFTEGYCLYLPVEHLGAVADMDIAELSELSAAVEVIRSSIERLYGPTIIAEHASRGHDLGAACCTHAHLHLIPVADPEAVRGAYRRVGGQGTKLPDLSCIPTTFAGPYVSLSPRPGEHLAWSADGFARQFVRRICAQQHGLGERYDWRDHPFRDLQRTTLLRLRAEFAAQAVAEGGPSR